jgi:hypothetical protein
MCQYDPARDSTEVGRKDGRFSFRLVHLCFKGRNKSQNLSKSMQAARQLMSTQLSVSGRVYEY